MDSDGKSNYANSDSQIKDESFIKYDKAIFVFKKWVLIAKKKIYK